MLRENLSMITIIHLNCHTYKFPQVIKDSLTKRHHSIKEIIDKNIKSIRKDIISLDRTWKGNPLY